MAESRAYPNDLLRRRILVALEQAPDGVDEEDLATAANLAGADADQRAVVLRDLADRRLILLTNADQRARYYHPKHAERMAGG